MLIDCERFFTGDMITVYTKLDGPTLMKKIKDEVIEYNYDLEKLYKALKEKVGEEES